MKGLRSLVSIALLLLCIVPAVFGADAHKGAPEVVAAYGDVSITAAELDRAIGNRLMRVRTDEYNIRRNVLEDLLSAKLQAGEAKRRGITLEELLKQEIDAKVATPTALEVEPFYEATKERYGNVNPDEAVRGIIESMRRQKTAARLAEFNRQLRQGTKVRMALEPPRIQLAVNGPTRGNAAAPVTIVEYSDFECPFCGRAVATLHKLLDQYGDDVRLIYRDFPLPSHRGSPRAAEAAHCAGDQGKYWEMNDRLFSKGGAIGENDIRKFAADLQLDTQQFTACLDSGKHAATWKAAAAEGDSAGVVSTPTFFINGRLIAGAAPYETFAQVIDEELSRAGVHPEPRKASQAAATAERRTP
jgi:protein-disulfide isomerase